MEIVTPDEAKEAIACDQTCKKLGTAIFSAYPSRQWYIHVYDKGDSAIIKIPSISMVAGVFVHLTGSEKNNMKRAIHAAGELLERFNLTRGQSDNTDLGELAKDPDGKVVGSAKGEI